MKGLKGLGCRHILPAVAHWKLWLVLQPRKVMSRGSSLPLAAPLQLEEEVKALPVAWLDALPLKEPLSRMQPQHGDIIVVQEELSPVRTLRAAQLHFLDGRHAALPHTLFSKWANV
jgi:hypothetical protein